MASMDVWPSTKPKDQKQRLLKPNNAMDETLEEENEADSKSDSDKLVGGAVATSANAHSIYASQRQRRRETASAFQKKLEEKRKTKTFTVKETSADKQRPVAAAPEPRPSSAAGGSVALVEIATAAPKANLVLVETAATTAPKANPAIQISFADSGYMTQNRIAPPCSMEALVESVKHGETIPPATKTGKKSSLPVPTVKPQILSPVLSPVSETDEYFFINTHQYRILNKIGKGGSSQVYQVYDEHRKQCFAVKRVDLSDADDMVVTAYLNEISLLKRLQKYPDRVVRMYDYEYLKEEQRLYVVMEVGDTDLATLFKSRKDEKLPDLMIAFYWMEMLKAVQVIHEEGIVHSDLKPANFLLVAGKLKLIDFGIANAVPANKTSVTRECQMGTLNYMSPEGLSYAESGGGGGLDDMKLRVGVKSDVWSLGCILYNMVYGKTPFQDIRNPMSKMSAILNRKHVIQFPPTADDVVISVMKRCLERDPKRRASIEELLSHPYCNSSNSGSSMEATSAAVPEDNLCALAESIGKATPRTGARLLKAALDQVKGAQGDKRSNPAKGLKF